MSPPISAIVDVTVTLTGATSDAVNFGALCGIFDHSVGSNRIDGPYTSLPDLVAAGFTAAAEPEVHAWATAAFGQSPKVDQVLVGREDSGDADITETLDAVEAAAKAASNDWYITNIESRAQAVIEEAAAWVEARNNGDSGRKIFVAQTLDAAVLAGTAANVALELQAAEYDRTALIYHRHGTSSDGSVAADGYLDGAWSSRCGGFDLDAPNGAGAWYHKGLATVSFDPITGPQATAIRNADANFYGRVKGLNFTQDGKMASGRFIDVTTSLDWLGARIEEEVLAEFVGEPTKIAFTNAGITRVETAIERVYERGLSASHLSRDERPTIAGPDVRLLSQTQKGTRQATFTGAATLAGGLVKATVNVNVQQ